MESVKVGVMGLGTVGCGTVAVLMRNSDEIARRVGRTIEVVQVADREIDNPKNCDITGLQHVKDAFEVANNPDLDVVVELIGGDTIAKDLVLAAIKGGKHVVTANKALIAKHGNEIFAAAKESGVVVGFEAAVAGGIPIIKSIREGMSANRIEWLAGIINGTGNYILTEMEKDGADFESVLSEAQRLGYAEADPTFDVEGIDAAHKLAILASIAFGIPLQFEKVYTEGISNVTREDVTNAEELGYRIKHLGIARHTDNGIEMRVHPTLIPEKRLIANVNGVMNAVLVHCDALGASLHYGAGAGAEPTASAVVADIVDVARALTSDPSNRIPHLAFQEGDMADTPILDMGEVETAYYLRLNVKDQPGVLADITGIFGDADISIEALLQKPHPQDGQATVIMLTKVTKESQLSGAMERVHALNSILAEAVAIRVESLS